jgi:putative PIN family toxin of toxin-antitoxin system
MIDTNVLISAFVLSSPHILKLIENISEHHTIVLPTYVLDELKRVTKAKFPEPYMLLESFLHELPFELVYTPEKINPADCPVIRDKKDLPVLLSAIKEDVDILISGDSDFDPLNMEYPEILTPREFVEKYC